MKDVKAIAGEEIAQQHRLVVGVLCIESPREAKKNFVPRRKTWKLKNGHTASVFQTQFSKLAKGWREESSKLAKEGLEGQIVQGKWSRLKGNLLVAAEKTCGWTKGPSKRHVTW